MSVIFPKIFNALQRVFFWLQMTTWIFSKTIKVDHQLREQKHSKKHSQIEFHTTSTMAEELENAHRTTSEPKFFQASSSSFHVPNAVKEEQDRETERALDPAYEDQEGINHEVHTSQKVASTLTAVEPLPPSSPTPAITNDNSSGLFVRDSDDDEEEEQEDEDTEIDDNYTLFESQIQAIIPGMGLDVVSQLYERFKDADNCVMQAVNHYYDGAGGTPLDRSSPPTRNSSQHTSFTTVQHTSSILASLRRRPRPAPSGSQFRDPRLSDPLDPHLSSSPTKKSKVEIKKKQLSMTIDWRRYIGSLQFSSWATRPTIRALPYGTQLSIVKTEGSAPVRGGRNRRSIDNVSSYLKLIQDPEDPKKRKEIGRMPEDIAGILFPLVDQDICDFDVTVVFCDGRLSTGDSFLIQVDCYLTSNIFKDKREQTPNGKNDLKLMRQESAGFDKHAVSETPEEKETRRRQVALLRLFNKLDFQVKASDFNSEDLDKDDEKAEVEVIDLSDDEQVANISSTEKSTQSEPTEEMNLNQLKEFYKRTQTEKILATLPETEPSANFQLDLRSYQKQGLTWMLRNERELEQDPDADNLMNPLWKEFKFPNDRSWHVTHNEKLREKHSKTAFYANLYSGEFSLEKPVLKSMVRGGILADEMGLGKTISTLSLIHYVPTDTSVESLKEAKEQKYAYKTTLIIVPTSLLQQWQDEFDKSNGDGSEFFVYYGSDTTQSLPSLLLSKSAPMVVFTTYGTVQTEWARYTKNPASNDGLYAVKWFRVVLDEGHNIRNRMNKTTKACYDLRVSRKWLLTGTPIINRLDDLYSLIKFLELEPWSHISYWNTFITVPFLKKDYKQALDVVASILDPILLRRTKNMKRDGKPLVELPSKQIIIERIKFSAAEQNLYNWFLKLAESSVKQGIKRGDILKKYTQILVHILRLRQICCHMDLVRSGGDELDEDLGNGKNLDNLEIPEELLNPKVETFTLEELNDLKSTIHEKYRKLEDLECSICTTQPIEQDHITFTTCSHVFCHSCILEHCEYQKIHGKTPLCPNCRGPISSTKLLQPRFISGSDDYQLYKYDTSLRSSKVNALLTHIRMIKDTAPQAKLVVFSQFSSYLDIMEREISLENDVKVLKFHGKLSMEKRSEVLKEFKTPRSQITVLLISLKAGGVGLNLTEANTAFMCDPWWSPGVEDQAIDRIHRIGQENDVKVIRFIMEGSIEEKMLKIQERKRTIGEAVEAEEEERRKRRVEEIQMLFEG